MEVCESSNGEDALNKAKVFKPNLLITDISIPKLDGLNLLKKLKEINSNLIAILISGYNNNPDIEINGVTYLQKPFSIKELYNTILHLTDNYYN